MVLPGFQWILRELSVFLNGNPVADLKNGAH